MISFTENAIKKLKASVDTNDVVRIGVVGGGCAGLQYTIEIEESPQAGDVILDIGDVKVCLNAFSSFQLRQTTVDYQETLRYSGFKFDNPKAVKNCGCGTSYKPEKGTPKPPPSSCATSGCSV